MARKKIDFNLFMKKCPSQPTVEYIESEFNAFLDYCQENNYFPTKHGWYVFLSASKQQVSNWKAAHRNITDISEEEFNRRRDLLKKIDDFIEESLSYDLLTSDRTNGNLIFYMKNSFKWTDRPQQDDISINIKTKGFLPSNKVKKGKK